MWFHREPPIRRLEPVVTANTNNFVSHPLLMFSVEEMFNHRIAEYNINALIRKTGQVCRITHYRKNTTMDPARWKQVQKGYLYVLTVCPPSLLPKLRRTPDVQN